MSTIKIDKKIAKYRVQAPAGEDASGGGAA